MPLFLDEIFGLIAEEKEDENITNKMVETRNKKAVNSLFFIA